MRYWDFIVLTALIYTSVVTPYEVALIAQSYGGLFVNLSTNLEHMEVIANPWKIIAPRRMSFSLKLLQTFALPIPFF